MEFSRVHSSTHIHTCTYTHINTNTHTYILTPIQVHTQKTKLQIAPPKGKNQKRWKTQNCEQRPLPAEFCTFDTTSFKITSRVESIAKNHDPLAQSEKVENTKLRIAPPTGGISHFWQLPNEVNLYHRIDWKKPRPSTSTGSGRKRKTSNSAPYRWKFALLAIFQWGKPLPTKRLQKTATL